MYKICKTYFDRVSSLFGIIIVSPVIIFLSLISFIVQGRPIFFKQERIGFHGKKFFLYKFRSMKNNQEGLLEKFLSENEEEREKYEKYHKLENDPRITKWGRFLRKSSLDELPQLYNVLRGEMSLVGPRPLLEKELEKYGELITEYQKFLPGITGLWQVSGRSELDFYGRIEKDREYFQKFSFILDCKILIKTIFIVLQKKGSI